MNSLAATEVGEAVQPSFARARGLRSSWLAFGLAVAAAWAITVTLHVRHSGVLHTLPVGLTTLSWLAMTTSMMAPTAIPMLSTLRSVLGGRAPSVWWAFLAAYLCVWGGFALGAAVMQIQLGHFAQWSGDRARVYAAAVLLAVAGLYQFSALKARCLRSCTNPLQWFLRHWRDGRVGALAMGLRHGVTCVGCCWALMSLAVVGGAAAFVVMLVTAVLMLIEKLPGKGERWAKPIGALLLVVAATLAATAPSNADGDHDHAQGVAIEQAATRGALHIRNRNQGDSHATLVADR